MGRTPNWLLASAIMMYISWCVIGQDLPTCKRAETKFGNKQTGQLLGHVTEEHNNVRSMMDCLAICGRHSQCLSVNFASKTRKCQINTHVIATALAEEFAPNKDIIYMENFSKY